MSQSSQDFLHWTGEECRQNWQSALPKLTQQICTCSDSTNVTELLKLVTQRFLPVIPLTELEEIIFSQIGAKITEYFSHVLDHVRQLLSVEQQKMEQQEALVTSLQEGIDMLRCLEACLAHISVQDDVQLADVHSLPPVVIHCVHTSYAHCKDSSNTYGDLLGVVSEQLTQLFKAAHSLQMNLITLLDKVSIDTTEQDIQDLCLVVQSLHDISQIAVNLDVKIMVTLWKTISRLACQHKELLCNRLELGPMLTALTQDMCTTYKYIFQLVPQPDQQSGDEKAFLKQVKVLGFQMKVLLMLLKEYLGYHGNCIPSIYRLLLTVQKNVLPALSASNVPKQYLEELERQVTAAVEPLLACLVAETDFVNCVLAEKQDLSPGLELPRCLTLVALLNIIPTTSDDVQQQWIEPRVYPEEEPRQPIVKTLFQAFNACYVEMHTPVKLPGVMCHGKPLREVSLYEHVCTRLCAFVACYPAIFFKSLEECLLVNVLCPNLTAAVLAVDTWCFLARYGSAELCKNQVHFLTHLLLTSGLSPATECCNIVMLLRRLLGFLAPDDQEDFLNSFPAKAHLELWSILPLHVFSSSMLEQHVQTLIKTAVLSMDDWVATTDRTAQQAVELSIRLRCLRNLFQNSDHVEQNPGPEHTSTLLEKSQELLHTLPLRSVAQNTVLQGVVSAWLDLCATLVGRMKNLHIIQMLRYMYYLVLEEPGISVKSAVLPVLGALGRVQLAHTHEQAEILQLLAQLFSSLLVDAHPVLHQRALETFAQFAEETVHETVVAESLQHSTQLQDTVVSYLNSLANNTNQTPADAEFLDQQHAALQSYSNQPSELVYKPATWKDMEELETENLAAVAKDDGAQKPAAKKLKTEDAAEVEESEAYQKVLTQLQQGVASMQRLKQDTETGELPEWVHSELETVHRQLGGLFAPPR